VLASLTASFVRPFGRTHSSALSISPVARIIVIDNLLPYGKQYVIQFLFCFYVHPILSFITNFGQKRFKNQWDKPRMLRKVMYFVAEYNIPVSVDGQNTAFVDTKYSLNPIATFPSSDYSKHESVSAQGVLFYGL
jgi:hypothetical protein